MFSWLKKINPLGGNRISVGIQVTDELVRFVAFRITGDSMETYAFGEEFLSGGTMKHGKIVNPEKLTITLNTIRKKYKFSDVTVVLPEEQSFIFYTNVSKVEANELQRVIQDHIVSHLKLHSKLSVRDLVCEYDILGEQDGNYEIQVTVTPRAVIETYVRAFEDARLNPVILEVGSHMVSRACVTDSEGQSCMLVDFGNDRTHISVVSEGAVMSGATLDVGEKHISPVIEKFLNINPHEAGRIKSKYGVSRTHKEPQLLSDILYELSPIRDYVDRKFIDWHTKEYKGAKERHPIQKIILHGEGAQLSGFAEHLAASTRIPVEHANVWANSPEFYEGVPSIHKKDALRYAAAISGALEGLRQTY